MPVGQQRIGYRGQGRYVCTPGRRWRHQEMPPLPVQRALPCTPRPRSTPFSQQIAALAPNPKVAGPHQFCFIAGCMVTINLTLLPSEPGASMFKRYGNRDDDRCCSMHTISTTQHASAVPTPSVQPSASLTQRPLAAHMCGEAEVPQLPSEVHDK
jgi:hypothetical protein